MASAPAIQNLWSSCRIIDDLSIPCNSAANGVRAFDSKPQSQPRGSAHSDVQPNPLTNYPFRLTSYTSAVITLNSRPYSK